MSKQPTLSIIIPNFGDNRISTILNYLSNEDKNSMKKTELIIVEGNTENPLKSLYVKFEKIISNLIIENDKGIFDALNKGVKFSKGKYILLIGSDDSFSAPGIIKLFFNSLDQHDIYGINCNIISSSGKILRKWDNKLLTKPLISNGYLPPHFSVFISRLYYEKIGQFKTSLGQLGLDSIWLFELRKYNFKYKFLGPKISTNMQQGGASTSSLKNILKGNWVFFKFIFHDENILKAFRIVINKLFSKIFQIQF